MTEKKVRERRVFDRLDLTEREFQVFWQLACGDTYAQAATRLGVSVSTVKSHVQAGLRRNRLPSSAALLFALGYEHYRTMHGDVTGLQQNVEAAQALLTAAGEATSVEACQRLLKSAQGFLGRQGEAQG